MACSGMHTWTVSSLISVFFKLVLAFILLWVASVSFVTAGFLGFFGLRLPCSCNDFIQEKETTTGRICVQAALIECPFEMISSIRCYILSRFPFVSNCTPKRSGSSSNVNAGLTDGPRDPLLPASQVLRGASCHCNSVSPQDRQRIGREGRLEIRDAVIATGKSDSASYAVGERKVCCQHGRCCLHCSCNSLNKNGNCVRQDSKQKVDQGPLQESKDIPLSLHESSQNNVIMDGNTSLLTTSAGDDKLAAEIPGASDLFSTDNLNKISHSDDWYQLEKTSSLPEFDGLYTSNDLKRALRGEREARKALYQELEEERKAAATAADEAMAMISRLQSEKASIEMELRQFKRMTEEKSAYDEETTEILKEILVRLESEKFYLQDEVEMYRQGSLKEGSDKWDKGSYTESTYCNENGFHERDMGRLQMTNDDPEHILEDNLSIHDVHVIQTPTKGSPEKNMLFPLSSTSETHKRSDQLQGISNNGLNAVENNVLVARNSGGISSHYEYENPASSEQKASNNDLDLNSRDMHNNRSEGTTSCDLCTVPMILKKSARMKVEKEIEHLRERLVGLTSSMSAISSLEHTKIEEIQTKHLEEIAQCLRDLHNSKEEGKHVQEDSLPSESAKKSFLALYSTF